MPYADRGPFHADHQLVPARCLQHRAGGTTRTAGVLPADIHGTVVVHYRAAAGHLRSLLSGHADTCDADLWSLLSQLYPPKALALVTDFVVFEGASTEPVQAFVEPVSWPDLHRWRLAVDVEGLDSTELVFMAVHELGHLMSLGPDQVDPVDREHGCYSYPTSEGCTRQGYLDGYVSGQWGDLIDQWLDEVGYVDSTTVRDSKALAFATSHQRYFVDEYAGTSPEEDFAETLATWALRRAFPGERSEVKGRSLGEEPAFRDVRARVGALG